MFNFSEEKLLPIILLVDDDLVSREVVATVLTMSGYSVHTAADGAASLQLLDAGECNPGVILVDAQMPGLSGSKLIGELRTRSKASIFTISASKLPNGAAAAADGFLQKPFGAAELARLMKDREAHAPQSAPLETEQNANEPIVDPETLAQLRNIMPEARVRQIYAAVVTDLGRRMTALKTAMAKGDDAEVRRIGHAIKGGCAMAGALRAARVGALIESGMLDGGYNQVGNSTRLLGDLRNAILSLERMLKNEFPA